MNDTEDFWGSRVYPPRAEAEDTQPLAGDVEEWLDGEAGRVEDLFALWTSGKRSSRWLAEQLIDEGHLGRLHRVAPTSVGGSE